MKKRLVITGLGALTGHGNNPEDIWQKVIQGESSVKKLNLQNKEIPCQIGSPVENFKIDDNLLKRKEQKRTDKTIHWGVYTADKALKNAQFDDSINYNRVGNIVGTGFAGLMSLVKNHENYVNTKKITAFPAYTLTQSPHNMLAGYISLKHNLKGVSMALSTACASSSHAIDVASKYIQDGSHDAIVVSGIEGITDELGILTFNSIKALATGFNDEPEKASQPFSKNRNGFVLGEGSVSIIIEDYNHALKRNAPIIAEIASSYTSSDSAHLVAPDENANGIKYCMSKALLEANLEASDIDYINAHATSTPIGDQFESKGIQEIFGSDMLTTSTKSMTGHLLGGAGALEFMFCCLSIRDNIIPPTINLIEKDPQCTLNYVANKAIKKEINYVLSNSFGFAGTNCSIIIKRFKK